MLGDVQDDMVHNISNHIFYRIYLNIIPFQNQFVKKSAYDQEISNLKNENSNLKSDVVIISNINILQIQNILNVINFSIASSY